MNNFQFNIETITFFIKFFRPFLEFVFDVFKEVVAEVIVETSINPVLGIGEGFEKRKKQKMFELYRYNFECDTQNGI